MIHKPVSYGIMALTAVTFSLLGGCSRPQTMAPPVTAPQPAVVNQAPPVAGSSGAPSVPQGENVYPWQDVPVGQKVPIVRGVFDQGGYQLFAQSGETIVVPFQNQNMYVMKFGVEDNGMYFLNDGKAPTLYLPRSGYLENAAASNAKWYPFSKDFAYTGRPVYMGIAPSWSAYTGMGWYPGMVYYGGYWGYNPWTPGIAFVATPGLMINIGGRPYYGWNSYSTYYRSNPGGRLGWGRSYNYSSVTRGRSGSFGSGSRVGATGSFGRGRTPGGSSFGRTAAGSSGSFGRTGGAGSSFGRTSGSNNFGTARNTTGTGSFGRSTSGTGSSFGSSGGTRSSFGSGTSGTSGFGSSGGTRSSFGSGSSGFGSGGSSFGRSSSGTSSFGSGSSGSSFGRSSFGSGSSSGSSFGRSSGSSFGGGSSSFGRSSGSSFGGGRSGGRRR
jgi:hypothetical protein